MISERKSNAGAFDGLDMEIQKRFKIICLN